MNNPPLYVVDTHAVYWHRIDAPQLSTVARQVMALAPQGKAILVISHVVVAELFYLLTKVGQAALFAPLMQELQTQPFYRLEAITLDDVLQLGAFPQITEMHDRLIVLAARRLGATLITKDQNSRAASAVPWVW